MTQIPEIVERLSPQLLELHDYTHLQRIKDFFLGFSPYLALITLETLYCC